MPHLSKALKGFWHQIWTKAANAIANQWRIPLIMAVWSDIRTSSCKRFVSLKSLAVSSVSSSLTNLRVILVSHMRVVRIMWKMGERRSSKILSKSLIPFHTATSRKGHKFQFYITAQLPNKLAIKDQIMMVLQPLASLTWKQCKEWIICQTLPQGRPWRRAGSTWGPC